LRNSVLRGPAEQTDVETEVAVRSDWMKAQLALDCSQGSLLEKNNITLHRNDKLRMAPVWRCQINSIEGLRSKRIVELFVAEDCFNLVLLSEPAVLRTGRTARRCCGGWLRPSSEQRSDLNASWDIAISGPWKQYSTPLRPPAGRRRSDINPTAVQELSTGSGGCSFKTSFVHSSTLGKKTFLESRYLPLNFLRKPKYKSAEKQSVIPNTAMSDCSILSH
jgi:hypothetical protein